MFILTMEELKASLQPDMSSNGIILVISWKNYVKGFKTNSQIEQTTVRINFFNFKATERVLG